MKNSTIAWTDHTLNFWTGCTKISEGCKNCYASVHFNVGLRGIKWGPDAKRIRSIGAPKDARAWDRSAKRLGARKRVFAMSMADVFDAHPSLTTWRDDFHDLVRETTNLDWLILTKRPHLAARYYAKHAIPQNVWLGTSAENQQCADQRLPELAKVTDARVRFVSCEPLLGPIDLTPYLANGTLDWVIVGGESTFRRAQVRRPMDPGWARSLRDQAKAYGKPFFFKQHGGSTRREQEANGTLLDGVPHMEVPDINCGVIAQITSPTQRGSSSK